mmetsp:Transcript_73671/g.137688  ORF Transcript_73671/g.137688 Transcript_73671/m.137688 type:complete len:459 (+) Transcript_73671:40-1416(+)
MGKKGNQTRHFAGGFRADKEDDGDEPHTQNRVVPAAQSGDASARPKAAGTRIVDRFSFNAYVSFTVLANAFVIGLEQDVGESERQVSDRPVWYFIEVFFCLSFVIETLVRISCLRQKFYKDIWHVMDFAIVVCGAIDTFALSIDGEGGKLRLLTILRILRIVPAVRLVRSWTAFKELWLLVGGLVTSIKALGWVFSMLILIIYVCAIFITTEVGQFDEYTKGPSYDGEVWTHTEYFGTVPRSMLTLFQVMTLDGWCDDIVRHVIYRQPWMAAFFVAFLFITAFGVMNVVVGVIIENTLTAAQVANARVEQQQTAERAKAMDELQAFLEFSDTECTGMISREEFHAAAQSTSVQRHLQAIGLEFEELEELLQLLDYEDRGHVELARFVAAMRQLVGTARRRDIVQVEVTVGTLAQQIEGLEGKFSAMEAEVSELSQMASKFLYDTVRVLTGIDASQETF